MALVTVAAEKCIAEPGIAIPTAPQPLGANTETVQSGRLLFVSGTIPTLTGTPHYVGTLGRELDLAAGQDAARMATLPPRDSILARWTG